MLRNLAAFVFLLISILVSTSAHAGEVSLQKKMVWAHSMIVFPLDLDILKPWLPGGYEQSNVAYPLDVRQNYPAGFHQLPDVRSAKEAGLDGFSVDIFVDGAAANGYMQAADQLGGFNIAACLDGGTVDEAIKAFSVYCENASKHPSAARIGDAFVVFTYNSAAHTVAEWDHIRAGLKQKGVKIFLIGDLGMDYGPNGSELESRVSAYFSSHDAGYTFSSSKEYWPRIQALYKKKDKPFIGGMMPGYFRIGGGDEDAHATAAYRAEWHKHLASSVPWVHISTWNDLAETTAIMPTSDFNTTRQELTRWYASKYRGEKIDWKTPRLYITSPKFIYPGKTVQLEALVLNPGKRVIKVHAQWLDADCKPLGIRAQSTVRPNQEGTAVAELPIKEYPKGRFLRSEADMLDGSKVIARVISAPTLVLDPLAQPGYKLLYTSIPAHHALQAKVGIRLSGKPIGGKKSSVEIVSPSGVQPQFSEILFNGEILKNFLTIKPTPLTVPWHTSPTSMEIKGGTEWGFYYARITDSNYRTAWSDPKYVAPKGDLNLRESYQFEEGSGVQTVDSSPFRRVGILENVEWVSPGAKDSKYAVRFNGTNSRINPPLYQTPAGPFSMKLDVRPAAYEGHFFCDGGGMWMTTDASGHVVFVRLGGVNPHQWVTANSTGAIPLNEWTHLEFRWDGKMMLIFINGKQDGTAACRPLFSSWRRAIGCNPFGSGSAYYNGDLDNFEIKLLKP